MVISLLLCSRSKDHPSSVIDILFRSTEHWRGGKTAEITSLAWHQVSCEIDNKHKWSHSLNCVARLQSVVSRYPRKNVRLVYFQRQMISSLYSSTCLISTTQQIKPVSLTSLRRHLSRSIFVDHTIGAAMWGSTVARGSTTHPSWPSRDIP